jgi:hypothetical protein
MLNNYSPIKIKNLRELSNTTAINPLLEQLLEDKSQINNEIILFLNNYKTKDTNSIALIGLILWKNKQVSLNFSDWKENLLEVITLKWWDYEEWSEKTKKRADSIPFLLLTQVFWGLWADELPKTQTECITLFKGIDLALFYDTIIMRKGCILNSTSNELEYWYSRLISSVTEKSCKNLTDRLGLI